jgi:hypothetical protein
MKHAIRNRIAFMLSSLLGCGMALPAWAQEAQHEKAIQLQTTTANPEVPQVGTDPGAAQGILAPRVLKFSGTFSNQVKTQAGIAGLTFAIYKDQEGGVSLWMETQNVQVDEQGRYAAMLGSNSPQGMPLDLFSSNEARWLGITKDGVEQPRVLLVAVPYALKAVDADTLGGTPASDFVRQETLNEILKGVPSTQSPANPGGKTPSAASTPLVTSGTAGFVGKFTSSTDLGNSLMFDAGTGIGIATTTPSARLGFGKFIGPTITLWDSIAGDHYGFGINNSELQTYMPATAHFSFEVGGDFQSSSANEIMRIQGNGNVGIGTTTPNNLLSLGGGASATFGMDPNPSAASPGNTLTVTAGSASSASTDIAGGDLILNAGDGTGLGGGGNARIQTAGAVDLSGTTLAQLVDRHIIVGKAKQLTLASPGFTSLLSIHLVGTHTAGGRVFYMIRATDGGSQIATEEGVIQYLATANSITCTVQTTDKLHLGTVNSGCTPGFFNPGSQPGISVFDNVAFSSPAPIVVHEVYFTIENDSGSPIRLEP